MKQHPRQRYVPSYAMEADYLKKRFQKIRKELRAASRRQPVQAIPILKGTKAK